MRQELKSSNESMRQEVKASNERVQAEMKNIHDHFCSEIERINDKLGEVETKCMQKITAMAQDVRDECMGLVQDEVEDVKVMTKNLELSNGNVEVVCFIIKHLIKPLILGVDFLSDNKIIIDFLDNTIKVPRMNSNVLSIPLGFHQTTYNEVFSLTCKKYAEEIESVVDKSTLLTSEEKISLCQLLNKFESLFSTTPRRIKGYLHRINVSDDRPFALKSYPIPFAYRESVQKKIDEMLEHGIIRKEKTAFMNPLLVVKKKDGSVRLCLDARHLNSITIPENDIPPRIDVIVRFAAQNLKKAGKRRKNNQKGTYPPFRVNDLVLLRTPKVSDAKHGLFHKFFHLFSGPFRISGLVGPNAYSLVDVEGSSQGIFNAYSLIPYRL